MVTDPLKGIESTRLARSTANLVSAPLEGMRLAGICALAAAPAVVLGWQFHLLTALAAAFWALGVIWAGGTLIFGYNGYRRGMSWIADGLHDAIADWQHRRRQKACAEELQVPETALSPALPSRPPVAGDSALSRRINPHPPTDPCA